MSSAPEAPLDTDVLVLGASFAGLEVVLQLRRSARRRLRIVVVDCQAEHGYLPLVHERICDRIDVQATILPTAQRLAALPDTRFVQDEVVGLEVEKKTVILASGKRITARFIVVALGSVLRPPDTIEGHEHLQGYKMGPELERTRARLSELRRGDRRPRVAVIGGGISGVELAGELSLGPARDGEAVPQVTLVSAAPRLLPELSAGTGAAALRTLRGQGVGIELGARLVRATADTIFVRKGESGDPAELKSDLAIWAGGVRPAPVLADLQLPHTPAGWLAVGPTLQCFATPRPTQPDVFACGDAVRVVGGEGEWPTMQRAIECIWQAKVVARNVLLLATHAPGYPEGVPPLVPHRLRRTFFYGVSIGDRSLVVYRGARLHVPGLTPWFRRWLMRQYFARYAAGSVGAPAASSASAE